jgi:Flp pilus assembly protein TadD
MNRRDFLAGATGALAWSTRSANAAGDPRSAPFPVHYRKPSPHETLAKFVGPGADEFKGEAAAHALEQRLARIFAGKEPLPPALATWAPQLPSIRWANFQVLPGDLIRFEIATASRDKHGLAHHTGLWNASNFQTVESESVSSVRPWFADVTSHVFGRTPSFIGQLLKGNTWWRSQLDSASGIDVFGNQGIAVGDMDNDGMDEVYVCQPGGLPNRLYKFRPDGTAEDITARAGLDILDETTSALFLDLRNSGLQDLVVLRSSGPLLFLNRGDGTFAEKPDVFRFKTPPQGGFTGMAAADYDRDGRLDLYLCCYVYFQSEDQYQYPAPYHDARNGPPNFLFRNELTPGGGGAFEDVTEACGLNQNNDRFSFSPAWCDFDGDGWPDLYVANDFGRNNLYRNRDGKFRDVAAECGVDDVGPGMSTSWFDYDGDGRPDLYVSNMWTAVGQRVTQDAAFQPAKGNEEAYRRHTKGNSLYRNKGDGTFEETGPAERVEMGRWAWSSGGYDFDLDGVPEILVTSGMVTNNFGQMPAQADLESFFWRQVVSKSPPRRGEAPNYENGWNAINQFIRQDHTWSGDQRNVFFARKDGRYRDCSGVSGFDFADDSRTFAVTDFDGDGHPDVLLRSRLGPQIRALRNDQGADKPVIAISLTGTISNRDAIGARVEVNGQTQWIQAGSGFLSQHTRTLYFGLAGKDRAHLKIAWPSGATQEFEALQPGQRYRIREGSSGTTSVAFRPRTNITPVPVVATNRPEYGDSWLLEPIPTPNGGKREKPGFLTLYAGNPPALPASADRIDLARESGGTAAAFSLLRRYIFEYRSDLALPLTLLLDEQSRVRKIYAATPSAETMRKDLELLKRPNLAVPFPGRYYSEPHRNYFKLGAAFYWAGYPEYSLPYLDEVIRLRPDNWKALLAIGRIQQETGKLAEALETFKKIHRMRPAYAPPFVNAGEVLLALNDKEAAGRMFEQALAIDPDSAPAANQLGMIAASSGNFDEARKLFQRAITSRPDDSGTINNLAVLYAKQGQIDDAIAAFQYGIKVAPDDETLYLNLGRVYVMKGDRSKARDVLSSLLSRKPGNPVALKALAELDSQ